MSGIHPQYFAFLVKLHGSGTAVAALIHLEKHYADLALACWRDDKALSEHYWAMHRTVNRVLYGLDNLTHNSKYAPFGHG